MADQDESSKINIYTLVSPPSDSADSTKINSYTQIGTPADTVESAKINVYTLVGPSTEPPGNVIQIGCGKLRITEALTPSTYLAEVIEPFDIRTPDDPDGENLPIEPSGWSFATSTVTVGGLDHLEGKEVWALADGDVVGPLTVVGGEVDIGFEASSIVVGLRYTQQVQTLYYDAPLWQGTGQSKRKLIPAITLRVDCTRGLLAGPDFDQMTPIPELVDPGDPPLFTGDARAIIFGGWSETGFVCIEQRDPVPAQVNGIIIEAAPGDTGR